MCWDLWLVWGLVYKSSARLSQMKPDVCFTLTERSLLDQIAVALLGLRTSLIPEEASEPRLVPRNGTVTLKKAGFIRAEEVSCWTRSRVGERGMIAQVASRRKKDLWQNSLSCLKPTQRTTQDV